MENLFEALEKAIYEKDSDTIEQLRKKIINAGRDERLDKEFIVSLKGKAVYKNVQHILKNNTDSDDGRLTDIFYIKTISSLITHIAIECEQKGINLEEFPANELYVLLGNFLINRKDSAKDDFKRFIKERFAEFL